jgi:hypothetical protein
MVIRLSVIADPVVSLCIYILYTYFMCVRLYVCMYVYLCMHVFVCLFGSLVQHITATIGFIVQIKSE